MSSSLRYAEDLTSAREAELTAALADMSEAELPIDEEPRLADILVDDNAPMFCTWKIGT